MARLMKAAVWEGFINKIPIVTVKEVEVPVPKSGEVLVKVLAAPINPSDQLFVKGLYPAGKSPPCIAGFEGSGEVVETGGGWIAKRLLGKKVAVVASATGGTWAEYMTANAQTCIALKENIDIDQGSCFFVNPLTVLMFGDYIKKGKYKAAVHTAAASQVGRMLLRWSLKENINLINIVRRQEQVDLLTSLGAKYILNSSDSDFEDKLRKMSSDLDARIAFDAISGHMTTKLVNNLPHYSSIYIYGLLEEKPIEPIHPTKLLFESKKIEGAWLHDWLKDSSLYSKIKVMSQVQNMLNNTLSTTISARFGLNNIEQALEHYSKNMSAGKVIIKPWLDKTN